MNQAQAQAVETAFAKYLDLSAQADQAYAAVGVQNAKTAASHLNATVTVPGENHARQVAADQANLQDQTDLVALIQKANDLTVAKGQAYVDYQKANADSLQNSGAQEVPGNTGPIRTA